MESTAYDHDEIMSFSDEDYTLYNIDLFKEKRVGNISLRWCNVNNGFEIVKWIDDKRSIGKEYCIVVAFIDLHNKYDADIRCVGDRLFDLTALEYESITKIVKENWDRYKELRKHKVDRFIAHIKTKIEKNSDDEGI